MDSRWAPPSKKGPLSVVLEVGYEGSGSAGVVYFEDDGRRWIECWGSAVECMVAFCVDVLGQMPSARERPGFGLFRCGRRVLLPVVIMVMGLEKPCGLVS